MTNHLSFLPYGRQHIDADDVAAVSDVLGQDFLTSGPKIAEFEEALAQRVKARHAVSCSSGTTALHLAVLALGLGPGDAVIVPTITFLATANAVRYAGGDVVFADVDPKSGLMERCHVEDAYNRAQGEGKRVRAVFPVHLAGQCADLNSIVDFAERQGLAVVDDACHALGSEYLGEPLGGGARTTMSVFSFHPVKTIAMGEGGALTMDDPELARRATLLRSHGMERDPQAFENTDMAFAADGTVNPWYYEMQDLGFNFRVTDIQCALGISQLKKLDGFIERRRAIAAAYDRAFATQGLPVTPIAKSDCCTPAWHLYVVRIDFDAVGRSRASVMEALREKGIGSQVHYIPVHQQPYYRNLYGACDLAGAKAYYQRALSLPLYPDMSDADVERVVGAVADVLARGR